MWTSPLRAINPSAATRTARHTRNSGNRAVETQKTFQRQDSYAYNSSGHKCRGPSTASLRKHARGSKSDRVPVDQVLAPQETTWKKRSRLQYLHRNDIKYDNYISIERLSWMCDSNIGAVVLEYG